MAPGQQAVWQCTPAECEGTGTRHTNAKKGPTSVEPFFCLYWHSVDVVAAYSNLPYPHRTRAQLQHLLKVAEKEAREPAPPELVPRSAARRFGSAAVDELVAAYISGAPTTELMKTYGLSKSAVLKLLRDREVPMRRQPLTSEQIQHATALYESGATLVKVSEQLGSPTESIRRALIEAGVTIRPRGRMRVGEAAHPSEP